MDRGSGASRESVARLSRFFACREKSDLAVRVSEQTSFSKADAAGVVDAVLTAISDALARGESVSIAGFGSFSAESRPARQGRNPRTGETITIAALKAPSFQTGKTRSGMRGTTEGTGRAREPAG